MWEEPCISGGGGSGAVFFAGCNAGCVFCQNHEISQYINSGAKVSTDRLTEIFFELKEKKADNINLVTGTHYIPQIVESVKQARKQGVCIPIVYNTSGYETVESLKLLEGIVNTYLPDFKYWDNSLAKKYSHAVDYPEVAKAAIAEMVRQVGKPEFNEDGFIQSGVIVRQLLLPGHTKDSKAIIKFLYETYCDNIYISLMSQYTPMPQIAEKYPELGRRVTKREYESVIDFALELGIENAFIQDRKVAKESFIPEFSNEIFK